MPLRSSAPLLALLAALVLFLPLAGWGDTCDDCLGGGQPGCCPPGCALCLCCGPGGTVLAGAVRVDREPGLASAFRDAAGGGVLSPDPRDVFHVPKPFLL